MPIFTHYLTFIVLFIDFQVYIYLVCYSLHVVVQVLYSKLIINSLTLALIGLNRSLLFWLRRLGCVGLRTTVLAKTMARTLHGVYEKNHDFEAKK